MGTCWCLEHSTLALGYAPDVIDISIISGDGGGVLVALLLLLTASSGADNLPLAFLMLLDANSAGDGLDPDVLLT